MAEYYEIIYHGGDCIPRKKERYCFSKNKQGELKECEGSRLDQAIVEEAHEVLKKMFKHRNIGDRIG